MIKSFILMNTWLIPYHTSVVLAMAMSMAQAQSNQEIIANLDWLIPMNLVFASLPNLLRVLFHFWKKEKEGIAQAFWKAELYVVLLQAILHSALLLFAIFGPEI